MMSTALNKKKHSEENKKKQATSFQADRVRNRIEEKVRATKLKPPSAEMCYQWKVANFLIEHHFDSSIKRATARLLQLVVKSRILGWVGSE